MPSIPGNSPAILEDIVPFGLAGVAENADAEEVEPSGVNAHERGGAPVVDTAPVPAESIAGVELASGADRAVAAKPEALELGADGEAGRGQETLPQGEAGCGLETLLREGKHVHEPLPEALSQKGERKPEALPRKGECEAGREVETPLQEGEHRHEGANANSTRYREGARQKANAGQRNYHNTTSTTARHCRKGVRTRANAGVSARRCDRAGADLRRRHERTRTRVSWPPGILEGSCQRSKSSNRKCLLRPAKTLQKREASPGVDEMANGHCLGGA